jgi:hypothetical protein
MRPSSVTLGNTRGDVGIDLGLNPGVSVVADLHWFRKFSGQDQPMQMLSAVSNAFIDKSGAIDQSLSAHRVSSLSVRHRRDGSRLYPIDEECRDGSMDD